MNKSYRSFFIVLICISLLTCLIYVPSPLKVYAENGAESVYIVKANYLRLRSGPGTNYGTLSSIPFGTEISISDIKSGWGKCSYGNNVGWVSMDYVTPKKLFNGVYMVTPKCAPTFALDVCNGETYDGVNLQIWEATKDENQLFSVVSTGDGYYQLKSIHSGKIIDVSDASDKNGANVQLWTENDTDAQKWLITAKEDNYYTLTAKCSNLALDVSGGVAENGANIQQWTPNDSDAQLFCFVPIFIENSEIYLKQEERNTCTLAAATMILRKAVELGGQDYTLITEKALKRVAWGKGLFNDFTYNGMRVTSASIRNLKTTEAKKDYLIKMLQIHPEGIVVYDRNKPHAITLCCYDEDSDTFYVADPWKGNGCIRLEDSIMRGKTQNEKIQYFTTIWYIWTMSE